MSMFSLDLKKSEAQGGLELNSLPPDIMCLSTLVNPRDWLMGLPLSRFWLGREQGGREERKRSREMEEERAGETHGSAPPQSLKDPGRVYVVNLSPLHSAVLPECLREYRNVTADL